ncbi:uncharacterized protein LOC133116710 isoform X2 [Conger conger]|uniref:uncharacterized protein LOC133116710 isoform X2 n=1 Tax=Conger conger TaxID=82655 RepID=UPI002A5A3603|nr:uncharacterized protein LOC133116710 isoform X2 [Conger conger]
MRTHAAKVIHATMFLPFHGKPVDMIPRHIVLLLSVLLAVRLSHESDTVSVLQPKTRDVNPDGSATIDCQLQGAQESWKMQVSLSGKNNRKNNRKDCLVFNKAGSIQSSQYDTNQCVWRNSSFNHFQFTLFHLEPGTEDEYVCEFYRTYPVPIQNFLGKGTKLVSGPTPAPMSGTPVPVCPSAYTVPQCPELGPLNWGLVGLAGSLLLCCFMVTCAYIQLRVKQEKDMDASLTYVAMQPPQSHMEHMNGDAESNTTYMDMRKMQLQGRTSRRDMNYNSQQMTH